MAISPYEQIIRKNQVITPWGIGAIVPFPKNRSMMIAGLDMWDYGEDAGPYLIDDERLARHIGVRELREPPANTIDGEDTHLSLPAVLFPLWHYCPRCGKMKRLNMGSNDQFCSGTDLQPHAEERMIPERFVAICPHGHIQDFPVMEWVHRGEDIGDGHHEITRITEGSSTTLVAVRYRCSCGASRTMEGATREGALADIGVYCSGNRPWLGNNHEDCDQELHVVQAGGSNVWFPIVRSSIWIPPANGDAVIQRKLEQYRSILESADNNDSGKIESGIAQAVADALDINEATLQREWALCKKQLEGVQADDSVSEEDYRFAEYEALINGSGSDMSAFSCRHVPIEFYSKGLDSYFSGITLVRKLQETRAFVGFSRVEPNVGVSAAESMKQLSVQGLSWVPAVKVFGEGIFFRFNKDRIGVWLSKDSVRLRVAKLTNAYNAAAQRWGRQPIDICPEFVLIHTFSHMLINRLSFDCGYGSSSIRERIYCDLSADEASRHDMLGLLIYTASGDSEGSLGGLVRMGEPGHLEGVILRALEDALWCSSDPVCSQSEGQGPDSCNLAACHNCALLPETSCENGNRLLDRLLVVGGIGIDSGYFDIN